MKREWLIKARKKANLSQDAVATMIGVTRQTYLRYESGERRPSPKKAKAIEDILQVRKEHFFWS